MKRIITIGREFGSGGREFGRRKLQKEPRCQKNMCAKLRKCAP